jgi:hypothetical protein
MRRTLIALLSLLPFAGAQDEAPVDLGKTLRESPEFKKQCEEFRVSFAEGVVRAEGEIHYRGGGPCEYLVGVFPAKAHETVVLLDKGPRVKDEEGAQEYVRHLAEVLNNAFLAAGYRKGKPLDWERERPAEDRPPKIFPPEGETVHVYAEWKDADGKEHRALMSEWLWNFQTIDVMQPNLFVYTGSMIVDEGPPDHRKWLAAEIDGLIVAVLSTSSALIDNLEEGALDNGTYEAIPIRIPERGTRVTVAFSKKPLEATEKYPPMKLPPELEAQKKERDAAKKKAAEEK